MHWIVIVQYVIHKEIYKPVTLHGFTLLQYWYALQFLSMSLAASFFHHHRSSFPQLCPQSSYNSVCFTSLCIPHLWKAKIVSVHSLNHWAQNNRIRKQPSPTCQWFYVSIKGSWSVLWFMMAMQESHVIGVYEKRWLSPQDFNSVIRVVTVPVSLLLSLSTCTSYTHQSRMPAVHCSNECPTLLLLKFDDVLLKYFSFSTSFSSCSNFI